MQPPELCPWLAYFGYGYDCMWCMPHKIHPNESTQMKIMYNMLHIDIDIADKLSTCTSCVTHCRDVLYVYRKPIEIGRIKYCTNLQKHIVVHLCHLLSCHICDGFGNNRRIYDEWGTKARISMNDLVIEVRDKAWINPWSCHIIWYCIHCKYVGVSIFKTCWHIYQWFKNISYPSFLFKEIYATN